jgi:hypothetical protein
MDINKIKEKIKIAREAVEGEDEPYKTSAFQIILGKLLNSDQMESSDSKIQTIKPLHIPFNTTVQTIDFQKMEEELAKSCGVTIKELDDVISINNDVIQVIAPISGNEADKQIVATQCILITAEVALGQEWVDSTMLRKCLNLSGIGEFDHLARNLRRKSNLIRTRGKKPNLEYKLFGPGRVSAFQIIKKLAKGESLS